MLIALMTSLVLTSATLTVPRRRRAVAYERPKRTRHARPVAMRALSLDYRTTLTVIVPSPTVPS
jgi:hypothetical protein